MVDVSRVCIAARTGGRGRELYFHKIYNTHENKAGRKREEIVFQKTKKLTPTRHDLQTTFTAI